MKKSQMSKDFAMKHMLRCADGGMVKAIQDTRGLRERTIDEAVNGKPKAEPKPAPKAEAKEEEFDDASIGIRIPKQPAAKPAAPPKKKGLFGLGVMGLRDGGMVDKLMRDKKLPSTIAGVVDAAATGAALLGAKKFAEHPRYQDDMARRVAKVVNRGNPKMLLPTVSEYMPAAAGLVGAARSFMQSPEQRAEFERSVGAESPAGAAGANALRVLSNVGDAATGGIASSAGRLIADKIGGMAAGGKVSGPGGPTEDKIPAMLSDGEFVMPADSVKKIGAHNLEALRRATHKPVKMADGGYLDDDEEFGRASPPPLGDDPRRSSSGMIRTAAFQAPFTTTAGAPVQPAAPSAQVPGYRENASTFSAANSMPNPQSLRQTAYPSNVPAASTATPATGDFSDARDLRLANQRSGQYDRALAATDAMDHAMSANVDQPMGVNRIGNTFFGRGNADPNDRTIDIANANARAEMQHMDAQKQAGFDSLRQGLRDASLQNAAAHEARVAAYNQHIDDAIARNQMSNPLLSGRAKDRLLKLRAIDQQANVAKAGNILQARGQDISAETSRRGQDISAATYRRGQDLTADTAAQNRDVQLRGQNLTALSNQQLRDIQNRQLENQVRREDRQFNLDERKFGLEGQREQRAARQEGLKNFNDQLTMASTTLVDGKPVVDPAKVADTTDRVNYTMQQMGINVGDLPTELHGELIRRASTARNREEASQGIAAWLGSLFTGRGVEFSRDLRDTNAAAFKPGMLPGMDNVQTGAGEISANDFIGGNSLGQLKNKQNREQVDELMRKLRSAR